jgi:hypothetical protein
VASVDRPMLVELIEAEKAKLSPEALKLWKELEESHYFSNEAAHFINEDFTSEEADAFLRHQDHQIDILKRFDQMPEEDRRTKDVLTELWMGLKRADEAESRGEPAQPYWDKCVIHAASLKDRNKWGPGGSRVEELLGRTVDQALARLRECSHPEVPQEASGDAETVEEWPEGAREPRFDSPGTQTGRDIGTDRRPWWRRLFGG